VRRPLSRAALAALLLWSSAAKAADDTPCPRLRFDGEAVKLTEVERKLVCGDPGTDSWKKVSLPQAREFLTAFLQHRGRHFPEFRAEGETLVVRIGTTTHARALIGTGLDGIYDLGKRRKVVGELLTPGLLDQVKKAVEFELKARGYACPKVAVTADARDGVVRADADPRDYHRFAVISTTGAANVDDAIFRRYEAFVSSETFDNRLLSISADRTKENGLFASAYYDVQCTTAGMGVALRVVEAPPRLITIGIGADTEGLVQGRLRLKQARLGRRASEAELTLFANQRQQSLESFMRWYLRSEDRLHIMPAAFARRENEVNYEAAHSEAALSPSWTHDTEDFRIEARGGPAVDYFKTLRGLGPRSDSWFQFVTRAEIKTHLYEYYQRDPRRGWTATLETAHRVKGAYSDVSAQWLRAGGQSLWNLGNFEPPLAVLATRGSIGTTVVDDPGAAVNSLPPTQRFFLGGDADLRGVQRKRLPGDGTGFLTSVYQGVELRAGDVLPARVEPFLFIDAAMGGVRSFRVDPDVYYAPGAGVRWASPLGTIRTTLGRGLTWRRGSVTAPPRPHWQFFFSFGKEF
jgi:translocation and assembly module TamA